MGTVVNDTFIAVGRRKCASARVRIKRGTGTIVINGRPVDRYFPTDQTQNVALLPLVLVEKRGEFDAVIRVEGGGVTGQACAVSHGLARALQTFDPELRVRLKKAGLLRRDPRVKERKKSGQPGARKRFQFSKR